MRTFMISFVLCLSSIAMLGQGLSTALSQGNIMEGDFRQEIEMYSVKGLAFINVKINGQEFRFLIDTGAPNVISAKVAKSFMLPTVSYTAIRDAHGKIKKQQLVRIPELAIGEVDFINFAAIVSDFSQSPVFGCLQIDGIIGANMMRHAVWQIDYNNKQVIIANNLDQLGVNQQDYLTANFNTTKQYTPQFDITIRNTEIKNVMIDFGSSKGITVKENDFNKVYTAGNLPSAVSYGNTSIGLYGPVFKKVRHQKVNGVRMGQLNIHNPIIDVEKQTQNRIGTKILKNYTTILDWSSQTIFFSKQHRLASASRLTTTGLGYHLKDGKLVVGSLYDNSPAQLAGLQIGDVIMEMNGDNYYHISTVEYCELFLEETQAKPTATEVLVKRDNQVFSYVLAKKDIL